MHMPSRVLAIAIVAFSAVIPSRADETLHRYEGDVLPYDESAGWLIFDPCESPCMESLEDGHFVLFWPDAGDIANYHYWLAQPPDAPPHALGRVAISLQPPVRWDLHRVRWCVRRAVWRDA